MEDTSLNRLGLASAIGFAITGIVGGVIHPAPPHLDASAADIRAFVTGHHTGVVVGGALELVAPLVLVPFFVALRRRLADRDLGILIVAFGAATSTMALLGGLAHNVLYHGGPLLHDDASVALLYRTSSLIFDAGPALTSVGYLVAAAVAFGRTRDVPSWLVPATALVAVITGVGGMAAATSTSGGPAALGFGGFLLNVAWSVAVAVVVFRPRPAVAATPQPALS